MLVGALLLPDPDVEQSPGEGAEVERAGASGEHPPVHKPVAESHEVLLLQPAGRALGVVVVEIVIVLGHLLMLQLADVAREHLGPGGMVGKEVGQDRSER